MKDFWNDEESSSEDRKRGAINRQEVLARVVKHALSGKALSAELVAGWRKECFEGLSHVSEKDVYFFGAYRGTDHPRLLDLRVGIGDMEGAAPGEVKHELDEFFAEFERRLRSLSLAIEVDEDKSPAKLRRIAALAGWAHGEWVRIHPFANGSGRTARLIANRVLIRFRLLPVVGIRPRPEHPYESAAFASMSGDHTRMTNLITDLLQDPANRF